MRKAILVCIAAATLTGCKSKQDQINDLTVKKDAVEQVYAKDCYERDPNGMFGQQIKKQTPECVEMDKKDKDLRNQIDQLTRDIAK